MELPVTAPTTSSTCEKSTSSVSVGTQAEIAMWIVETYLPTDSVDGSLCVAWTQSQSQSLVTGSENDGPDP